MSEKKSRKWHADANEIKHYAKSIVLSVVLWHSNTKGRSVCPHLLPRHAMCTSHSKLQFLKIYTQFSKGWHTRSAVLRHTFLTVCIKPALSQYVMHVVKLVSKRPSALWNPCKCGCALLQAAATEHTLFFDCSVLLAEPLSKLVWSSSFLVIWCTKAGLCLRQEAIDSKPNSFQFAKER